MKNKCINSLDVKDFDMIQVDKGLNFLSKHLGKYKINISLQVNNAKKFVDLLPTITFPILLIFTSMHLAFLLALFSRLFSHTFLQNSKDQTQFQIIQQFKFFGRYLWRLIYPFKPRHPNSMKKCNKISPSEFSFEEEKI